MYVKLGTVTTYNTTQSVKLNTQVFPDVSLFGGQVVLDVLKLRSNFILRIKQRMFLPDYTCHVPEKSNSREHEEKQSINTESKTENI
jgi:hypothetical protein